LQSSNNLASKYVFSFHMVEMILNTMIFSAFFYIALP